MPNGLHLRICDYIFVLRPLILIPAWSFYLLGSGEAIKRDPQPRPLLPSPEAFTSLTAILITAYLLNQIFDRESGTRNNKCLFLAHGIFGVRTLLVLALLFYLLASFMFRKLGDVQRIPLLAALVVSLIYSLPPLRLCARPFLDLLANAAGFGCIAFVIGFGSFGDLSWEAVRLSLPYVSFVGATFLHTAVLDMEGDRETGKHSTAVLIGMRASVIAALLLHALAVVVSILVHNYFALALTGVSFPITLGALLAMNRRVSSFHVQALTLIVTLGAASLWPAYLVILIPLIALSRYYHRRRFGIIYPGLGKGS